jgi:hypothetical protein
MEATAYYDRDNNIVVVAGEGSSELTTERVKHATALAMKVAMEHQCTNLLFDITMMKESQSIIQLFMDMSNISLTTGLSSEYKCAVLYNPATYSPNRAELVVIVVKNRPNPPFKMLTNRKEAVEWLKGS